MTTINNTWTSEHAAASIEPITGFYRRLALEYLTSCGARGSTHREAELATGIRGDTLRPRFKELEQLGYIVNTGTTRRNPGSNLLAIVWCAVFSPTTSRP